MNFWTQKIHKDIKRKAKYEFKGISTKQFKIKYIKNYF